MSGRDVQFISHPAPARTTESRWRLIDLGFGIHIERPHGIVFLHVEQDDVTLIENLHRIRLRHDPWHALWIAVADGIIRHRVERYLYGRRGNAWSALVGILIIQSIANGLTLIDLDASARNIATGVVLVLAVTIDTLLSRRRRPFAATGDVF